MSKHTKGPWVVAQGGIDICALSIPDKADESSRLCVASAELRGVDYEQALNNARLIAAAPELLEALEQLVMINKIYSEDKEHDFAWAEMQNAKQIIAKAKGEI